MDKQNAVVQDLREFISATGKKQSAVAKAIGVSTTAISQFLSGQYIGDNDGLADKISKYILQEEPRDGLPKVPSFTLTRAAKQVFIAAKCAYDYNEIALVYGRAGVGKTTAIQEYVQQHAGVVYVVIRKGDGGIKSACSRILKALDKKAIGTQSALMDAVIDSLGNTNRLLIIDEAQHLTTSAIDSIRSFNDEGNIPILFAGNPKVYSNMFGREEEDLDQIYSRIGVIQEIKDKPHIDDIQAMFDGFGLDVKCIEALYHIACCKGGLRRMVKAYRNALILAASKREVLSAKHIQAQQSRRERTHESN